VVLVRTDVSEEDSTSIITVGRISDLRQLLVTANIPSSLILSTLMTDAINSSETLVLTRGTQRLIPEDGIRHSHRHENLKSFIELTGWSK
jgi:hypothetical protein